MAMGGVLGALLCASGVARAEAPDWVRQFEDRTEVCAIPIEGDPAAAEPPPLTALQTQRRQLEELPVGPLVPPAEPTLVQRSPAGVEATAMAHPLRPGWSLVRVEASVGPRENALEQHVTIAVDTSTSMASASFRGLPILLDEPPPERGAYRTVNRLVLAREALHELVDTLDNPEMTVAFVAFHAANASEILPPTPATDKAALHAAIERIREENVGEGEVFETMYTTASKAFAACADDRLLVLSDDTPRIQGDPEEVYGAVRTMAEQGLRLHTFALATKVDLTPIAKLTVAGGGELHAVDTIAEARAAFGQALRTIGSTLGEPSVTVSFDGAWRTMGPEGPVDGSGTDSWSLPSPLPSDWTAVKVYEAAGPATVTFRATPYSSETQQAKAWSDTSGTARSVQSADPVLRHATAYYLAEHGIRVPADRAKAQKVLAEVVREVGPGREAQALLEAHAN